MQTQKIHTIPWPKRHTGTVWRKYFGQTWVFDITNPNIPEIPGTQDGSMGGLYIYRSKHLIKALFRP